MNKLTGEEVLKILTDNFTLEQIGENDYYEITGDNQKEYFNEIGLGSYDIVLEHGGGEGDGSDHHIVYYFKEHDVYVRIDGYYQSYHGTDWEDKPYLVKPEAKTVIVYE